MQWPIQRRTAAHKTTCPSAVFRIVFEQATVTQRFEHLVENNSLLDHLGLSVRRYANRLPFQLVAELFDDLEPLI